MKTLAPPLTSKGLDVCCGSALRLIEVNSVESSQLARGYVPLELLYVLSYAGALRSAIRSAFCNDRLSHDALRFALHSGAPLRDALRRSVTCMLSHLLDEAIGAHAAEGEIER